jgi:hypothetical protein
MVSLMTFLHSRIVFIVKFDIRYEFDMKAKLKTLTLQTFFTIKHRKNRKIFFIWLSPGFQGIKFILYHLVCIVYIRNNNKEENH